MLSLPIHSFQGDAIKTKLAISLIIGLGLAVAWTALALADSGPHGNYTALTDACAGCHRTHTSEASSLLIAEVPDLCFTCHSAAAAGADTNVVDGLWEGAGGGNLLGGGFTNYQGLAASSSHSYDKSWQNAWGSGTTWVSTYDCAGCHSPDSGLVWPGIPQWGISPNAWPTYPGRGQNVTMPLTCTNCHEVHGGRNYRMLQQRIHPPSAQQQDPPGDVLVTSNEVGGTTPHLPGYAPDYTTPLYRLGLGDWCTGCHYTYHQPQSNPSRPFNAEDGRGLATRYRHRMNTPIVGVVDPVNGQTYNLTTALPLEDLTGNGRTADDQLFCLSCHYAHGTNVVMTPGGYADGVLPANDSALLRVDNRGTCEDCHKK